MSFSQLQQVSQSGFQIPRFIDSDLLEKVKTVSEEIGVQIVQTQILCVFSDQTMTFLSMNFDEAFNSILEMSSVMTRRVAVKFNSQLILTIDRGWKNDVKEIVGNQDRVLIHIDDNNAPDKFVNVARLIAGARKHLGAIDTKPFLEFLEEDQRQVYQSREQEIQRLQRMQENFFEDMTKYTLKQQGEQQKFQNGLEKAFADRQTVLEGEHQERLTQFEQRELELKQLRTEIDDRENRQARRDIYKELKNKLKDRSSTFELSDGTKYRRWVPFGFILLLLTLLGRGFWICFKRNVFEGTGQISWITVGSQIGFGVAFIAVATFFIRWTHQWFQKHADEEFHLKRLDLDIDRANWLVELAMEWKNITKSDVPQELLDKLSRNLFVIGDEGSRDMNPSETLLAGLFGKSGSIDIEYPGKFKLQRSEQEEVKKSRKPNTD